MPTLATMVVAMPRFSRLVSSATSVMPAPSSPARPMPARNRSTSYWRMAVPSPIACRKPSAPAASTSATQAFSRFAIE